MTIEELEKLDHSHLLVIGFDEETKRYRCTWFDDGDYYEAYYNPFELLHEIQVEGCKVYGDFF